MNTKIIKLDINRRLYDKIVAKQDDTKSRFLLFQLLDGAVPFNLTDRSVRVYGVKPDGAVIFNDLTVTHSTTGFCLLELTNQMLAIAGTVKLELMITEGDKKLTSIPFEMEVIKKINSNAAVESSNEFRSLLNALKEIDDWNREFADKSGKLEELYTPRLNELGSQLETIIPYTDTTKENIIMTKIHKRLTDDTLKNRQYIMVGDSLRDSNGNFNFRVTAEKMFTIGVTPLLTARSGLTAEHWSKARDFQTGFINVDDTIAVINGTGAETVIDICLGTNDLAHTVNEIATYLKTGIQAIRNAKPNILVCLSTPNRYNYSNDDMSNKIFTAIKKVVDDLGNVAFIDVMNNVFKTREEVAPYLIDEMHPNEEGQRRVGQYNISKILPPNALEKYQFDFNELRITNTDGSITKIKYAIKCDGLLETDTFMFKLTYGNAWSFTVVRGSNEYQCSQLIDKNGKYVLRHNPKSPIKVYGYIDIIGFENLSNKPSTRFVLNYHIKNILRTIGGSSIHYQGKISPTDVNVSTLKDTNLSCKFEAVNGNVPTKLYLYRATDGKYYLTQNSSGSNYQSREIDKFFVGKAKINFDTNFVYIDLSNPLLDLIPNGTRVEISNYTAKELTKSIDNIDECNILNVLTVLNSYKFTKLRGELDKDDANYPLVSNNTIRIELKYTDNSSALDDCWIQVLDGLVYVYPNSTTGAACGVVNSLKDGLCDISEGYTSNKAIGKLYVKDSNHLRTITQKIKLKGVKVVNFTVEKSLYDLLID